MTHDYRLNRFARRLAWLAVFSVSLGLTCRVATLHGQPRARKEKEPEQAQPVVRVTTRLVEVNVVVQDRKSEPVPDLTRDDFVLYDDGHEQQISAFSVQSEKVTAAKPQPLPPDTFSNRLEYRTGAPASVTVILLDGLNTYFEDQTYARAQIVKFLRTQIRPQDRVALYTLGTNVRVLHDFTSDTKSLLEALAHYQVGESGEVGASERPKPPTSITLITPNTGIARTATQAVPVEVGIDDYIRQTSQKAADFYSIDRGLRTLSALQTIAQSLSSIVGRKNLVWVSSSFPFSVGTGTANFSNVTRGERTLGPEMERAERALNNANLAIYPVDARGLVSAFADQPNLSAEGSVSARAPGQNALEGVGQLTPTHDTMEELASQTGGRAFYGSNDVMDSVRTAIQDSRLTYTLGYYPSDTKWDGAFHEIKVKLKHSNGRVLCRRGYFAVPEKPLEPGERDTALREAALSPLESTGLGVTTHVHTDPASPRMIDLTVEVDPHGIRLVEQGDRWVGAIDFLFAEINPGGQMLRGLAQPLSLRLTGQEYQQILQKGISISGRLAIVPGAERVRVVVREATSGALGSIDVPLAPYTQAAASKAGK